MPSNNLRPDLHSEEWRAIRKVVLERDAWTCAYCGKPLAGDDATVDHLVPHDQGGTSTLDNLVACCRADNGRKSNRMLTRMPWLNPRWIGDIS